MTTLGLKKQISIFLPLDEWRVIRDEAARQKVPMAELMRSWIKPELSRLRTDA